MILKKGFGERLYRLIRTIGMSFEEDYLFRGLRDINLFAEQNGYDFEFAVVDPSGVPGYENIENYIRYYCHENLPVNQFKGIQQYTVDLMETGGRFIIKDGQPIMTYQAKPDPNAVLIGRHGGTSSTRFIPISRQESSLADIVVEWHTHPLRFSFILSIPDDIDFIANSINVCDGKPYFHALYSPAENSFLWYQAKLKNTMHN